MAKNKIAQIIPITRLKRDLHYFDYLIPEELEKRVRKGQLVDIPFRNKIIKGVVFDLVDLEKRSYRLKAIKDIVDPLPFLNNWQLKLIQYLSDYYFISMSVIAKMIIPEIPKKKRVSKEKFLLDFEFAAKPRLNKKVDQYYRSKKPALLRYVSVENKIKVYLGLIKKAVKTNKQVLIIVPQVNDIKKIYKYLLEYKNDTVVFLNDLPKNKYWEQWLKIKKGQAKIIIGTRSAIFAPFKNLDMVIIDQEESENHKQEEPNPRYHVKNVALKIQQLTKCRLFLASNSPSFDSLSKVQKNKWQYFDIDKLKSKPEIKIIDRQEEFKKGNYSILSEELNNRIKYSLDRAQKIFLFLNRKGLATLATCKDCGYVSICPTCNLPLTLHGNKKLLCHHCNLENDLFLFCPKCKGPNIKLTGAGTEKVELEINKLYPAARILKLDSDNPINKQDLNEYDVIIGTRYAIDHLNWETIDLIGVINADTLFYLPDYRSMEKTFTLLMKLASNLNNEKKSIIVQTFTPDNYVFKAYQQLDYKPFYINELKERQALGYPPFSRLIRLIYQSIEFNAGQREIAKVYESIKDLSIEGKMFVSPPIKAYTQQVRGRWRWQIIIKILDPKQELDFLHGLPENIIIDRDPESLL